MIPPIEVLPDSKTVCCKIHRFFPRELCQNAFSWTCNNLLVLIQEVWDSKRVFLSNCALNFKTFFFRIYVQQFLGSNSVISGMEKAFFPSEKNGLNDQDVCDWYTANFDATI